MHMSVLSCQVPLRPHEDCACRGLAGRCGELEPENGICGLCTVSVEKRIRAEQTWRRLKAFQDSLFRFQDWLRAAEATAASANSSQVSYANSKKELQRFEMLQKQVLEKLMPLEDLNRQYRQLVRTGSVGLRLRSIIQAINQRWDDVQRRASAVCKRLKYFVNQWEEFESERETIRLWLTEMDLRLTDVEHFSGGTALEKIIQLQAFQQDVQSNAERVDCLLVRGESLIQKSQPEDAEVLEEELQDLSGFCQEVFRRVFRFRRRLVSMQLVFENEWWSDRESDLDDSDSFTEGSLDLETDSPPPAPAQIRHSTPKKLPQQHECLAHPLGTTVDLEWDPSVDVGGSTSHDEEDSSYYSAITGVGQWEEPSRRCRSSRRMPRPLPVRCDSQEDLSVQSGWREEWEPFRCQVYKEQHNSSSRTSPSRHLERGQHGKNPFLGRGVSCRVQPVGFDPRRIESWLGQTHKEKMEIQLETEQVAGAFGGVCWPAPVLPSRMLCQTSGKQTKQQKTPQRIRKKVRASPRHPGPLICKRKQLDSHSGEISLTIEKRSCDLPQPLGLSPPPQKVPRIPALLNRLLLSTIGLLLLLLLASVCVLSLVDPSCLQTNGYTRSFHLMLKYINGPPPT